MKPTPNDFKKFVRDKERLERLKSISYDAWIRFMTVNIESESFKEYIDLIDSYLSTLKSDYDFIPFWISDYHKRRMIYWNPLQIKVEREINKVEVEPVDLSVYFTFKHRNILCELILN